LAQLYPQYRIVGIDRISYCSDERYVSTPLAGCLNFRLVRLDVCDYAAIVALMQEEQIDTVIHLAAQTHVDLSFKEGGPQQFVIDNIQATASLLESARKVNVRRFIHCSTDEVYGEGSFDHRVHFDEAKKMEPTNPYSATKAGADILVQTFMKCFGFPAIITRGNNVYGPHQFFEKVIPKFVAQLSAGKKLTIHGSGKNTRNFLHVQDTASAFDAILHCGEIGEIYNICGKNEKSVIDIAADLILILGLDKRKSCNELLTYVSDRAHNDACYPITHAKLLSLGWRERLSWEFGLANTVGWVLARLKSEDLDLTKVMEAHPIHSATDNAAMVVSHGAGVPAARALL